MAEGRESERETQSSFFVIRSSFSTRSIFPRFLFRIKTLKGVACRATFDAKRETCNSILFSRNEYLSRDALVGSGRDGFL